MNKEIMNEGMKLQNLVTRAAYNRIMSGNADKESMTENLSILLAGEKLTGNQYNYLMGLIEPVEDTLNIENSEITV